MSDAVKEQILAQLAGLSEDQQRRVLDFARSLAASPDGEETDEEREWLWAAATNPAFGFLKDAEEDVYSPDDGRPFVDQG